MSRKSPVPKLLNLWLPVLLWASVIFLFSAYPTTQTSEIYWEDFIVKKTAHMVEYAIFASLLFRAFRGVNFNIKKAVYYSFAIAVFYGFSDEFHQSFTPGREPHLRDVLFDTIGAGVAAYFLWKLLPKMPPRLLSLAKQWGFH